MIGIDEVGRGCLAGPLVVVALRGHLRLPAGIKDSKLLSPHSRSILSPAISKACEVGIGWVDACQIDEHGLTWALAKAANEALADIKASKDEKIILDGRHNYLPPRYQNVRCVVKADKKIKLVAAASIVAKVKRDKYMAELAQECSEYGFSTNMGYGTPEHIEALLRLGPVNGIHRMSFKGVIAVG